MGVGVNCCRQRNQAVDVLNDGELNALVVATLPFLLAYLLVLSYSVPARSRARRERRRSTVCAASPASLGPQPWHGSSSWTGISRRQYSRSTETDGCRMHLFEGGATRGEGGI